MFTNMQTWKKVVLTPLGLLCMAATLVAVLYTTASDALVAPKLKWGKDELIEMNATAFSSYGNASYVKDSCQVPDTLLSDIDIQGSCLGVSLSGFGRSTATPSQLRSREHL